MVIHKIYKFRLLRALSYYVILIQKLSTYKNLIDLIFLQHIFYNINIIYIYVYLIYRFSYNFNVKYEKIIIIRFCLTLRAAPAKQILLHYIYKTLHFSYHPLGHLRQIK